MGMIKGAAVAARKDAGISRIHLALKAAKRIQGAGKMFQIPLPADWIHDKTHGQSFASSRHRVSLCMENRSSFIIDTTTRPRDIRRIGMQLRHPHSNARR